MQNFLVFLAGGVLSLAALTAGQPQTCGIQDVQPDLSIGARRRRRGAITPQIVGGGVAVTHSWPWFASIQGFRHGCGGAVIADQWVVTAGHCILDGNGGIRTDLTAVLAEYDLTSVSPEEERHPTENIFLHPNYTANSLRAEYDIALMKLQQKLTFSEYIQPICLPEVSSYQDGDPAWVIGFGWQSSTSMTNSDRMRQVMVPLQLPALCRTSAYPDSWITDNHLCAGYPQGKKDACNGDSGGPLMVFNDHGTANPNDDSWELAGIVSWGMGCARKNHPGVYTRVTRFTDWIEAVMSANA